ncbi:hypothetical protein PHMEG_00036233 [Phytophthora megakarya]|uniref:Uncharacterized protein n=1 Tax=Phytophthora megakarya TaxID=4795 RepID=A0A225ULW5_9STRA|nr:hypothetical protein PHMEG_00036233 [Phytophthora megakarya]
MRTANRMVKAAYGSAAKLDCDKCERAVSRSNFSKHKKKCKGIRVRESRSEIRKRSWVKHRAKRVGDQRSRRAAQSFKRLQELREQLDDVKQVPHPPKPTPKGLKGHPLEHLSHNATLVAYIYDQVKYNELLSSLWLKKVYLLLHSDKHRHMPSHFQEESVWNLLEETCKAFSAYKDTVLNGDGDTVFGERVRLQRYRDYLETRYTARVNDWLIRCEEIDRENAVLSAHVQVMIDGFGEGKNCKCLAEFEEIYKAGFVEKDKDNEAKTKAKHVESEGERRFRETFGFDSDSDDE